MGNYTVFRDVHESLKSLIQSRVSELASSSTITYESPSELSPGATPLLSLFFFQLGYNASLRNTPPSRSGLDTRVETPLLLDMMFLLTPFSNSKETELGILEKLSQTFYDTPVLRGDLLLGNLKEEGHEELRIVPHEMGLEEINKLWTSFANKAYRMGLVYTVTPVRINSSRSETFTRVISRNVQTSEIFSQG